MSSDRIRLVAGDNRPYIRIQLYDNDDNPLDVTDPNITVTAHFRASGAAEVLAILPCEKMGGNLVRHNFPGNTLDVDAGPYEEEIQIDFDGEKQTVYDRIKFTVRDEIA